LLHAVHRAAGSGPNGGEENKKPGRFASSTLGSLRLEKT